MNAVEKYVAPDIEHLVLQTRAAHVYLDAIGRLSNPDRRRQNRVQAEEVMAELERFLQSADCSADVRARVEGLKAGLQAQLEKTSI